MKRYRIFVIAILLVSILVLKGQNIQQLPVSINFENPSATNDWVFTSNNTTNYWMIGNGVGNTGKSLYITNNGVDNIYSHSVITYTSASILVNFGNYGEYTFSFDRKGGQNCFGNCDRVEIYAIPTNMTIPSSWNMDLENNWITGNGAKK